VENGELSLINNATLSEGMLMVRSSGTLSGTGSVGGQAIIYGTLSPGVSGNRGLITFKNGLTLTSSSKLLMDLVNVGQAGMTYDSIRVSGGSLSLGGELTLNALSAGIYPIINYTGANYSGNPQSEFGSITATINGFKVAVSLVSVNSHVTAHIGSDYQANVEFQGTGDGALEWNEEALGYDDDFKGLVLSFSGVGGNVVAAAASIGGSVNFDTMNFQADGFMIGGDDLEIAPAEGSGNTGVVNVGAGLSATIESGIRGEGMSLKKVGSGLLVLDGDNTYTGGTSVESGTLQGDSESLSGSISVAQEATLKFNETEGTERDGVFDGTLSGLGLVEKEGTGNLTLANQSTFSGNLSLSEGSLTTGADNALGEANLTVKEGAILHLGETEQVVSALNGSGEIDLGKGRLNVAQNDLESSFQGIITGNGILEKTNDGVLVLTGANTYTGGTIISTGTLKGDTNSLQGDMLNNAKLIFAQDFDGTYEGALTGEGTLEKTGSGTLTLTGENSLQDEILISEGALKGSSLSIQGNIENQGKLIFDESKNGTFTGSIEGSGSLEKTGEGSLILVGENTYLGGTTVTSGSLSGDTLSLQGDIVNNASVVFSQNLDGTYSGKMTGEGGIIKEGSGVLTLEGDNAFTGANVIKEGAIVATTNLSLGTGAYNLLNGTTLSLGETNQLISGLTGEGALDLGLGELKVQVKGGSTDVFEGLFTGEGKLSKAGYGSLVLNSENATTGSVDVLEGTLIIGDSQEKSNASITLDNALKVYKGANLSGHGSINTDVVVNSGGALSPGNSIGIITMDSLTLESGSYFDVEVDTSNIGTGDRATVKGLATLAGTLRHISTSLDASDYLGGLKEWLILDASSLSGTFDEAVSDLVMLEPLLRYDYNNADVFLSFQLSGTSGNGELDDSFLKTENQKALYNVFMKLPSSSELFNLVAYSATDANISEILGDLSGEVHAALFSALESVTYSSSQAMLRHIADYSLSSNTQKPLSAGEGDYMQNRVWVSIGASRAVMAANQNAAKTVFQGTELIAGYDLGLQNGFLGGFALNIADKDLKTNARGSKLSVKSIGFTAYLGKEFYLTGGNLRLVLGGGIIKHDLESERRFNIGNAPQSLVANYNAHSWQLFFESAYGVPFGVSIMEPFVTFGLTGVEIDGFTETGGPAALLAQSENHTRTWSELGVRIVAPIGSKVKTNLEVGWKHLYGSINEVKTMAFQAGAVNFPVRGVTPNRNELAIGASIAFKASDYVTFSLKYEGAYGSEYREHSGTASAIFSW
jgi:autotransporter-associated beta strand protein